MSKTIAIIPARGGSKRLPNKNILALKGKPLLLHSIEYAKSNGTVIDEIVVSTDSDRIKDIALKAGVDVVDRPVSLSGDNEPTVTSLSHVLETLESKFNTVIVLQPTNPLRPESLMRDAFEKYTTSNCDSLMTVSPNYKKYGKIENNKFVPYNYSFGQRSQDMDPLFYENGLLYISDASLILQNKILGPKNFPFVVTHPFAKVDIDTEEDLKYAEFIMNLYT